MGLNTGALYIIIILFIIGGLAFLATGPLPTESPTLTGVQVAVDGGEKLDPQDKLTLLTFNGATITPPAGSICNSGGVNNRPEIIVAVEPQSGTAIPSDGVIKVWATDTDHLKIAPDARVSNTSGNVTDEGKLFERAPDGHYYAPSLYVFPQTVDNNGLPYLPYNIKGDYDNGTKQVARGRETVPYYGKPTQKYVLEYIWKAEDIGLIPDSYDLQFVISDSQGNHGVACTSIRVYEKDNPRYVIPD